MHKYQIIGGAVFVADGPSPQRIEDMDVPLSERVEMFITRYDPEWDNAREFATRIIAMVNDNATRKRNNT